MPFDRHVLIFLLVLAVIPRGAQAQSSTLTGTSRAMNPAISVNGLIRGQASRDNPSGDLNGFRIDGVEAQISSMVDPFWKANFSIGLHQEQDHSGTEEAEAHAPATVVHVEEAYIDGQALPANLGLRAGKFALPFGKHAPLHMHQFPFADAPAAISAFIGEHVFSDAGIMGTVTVPLPWYSDFKVYGVGGEAEPFDAENKKLAGGARLTNLWDLTDDATLEVSGSYLHGPDARHPGENRSLDMYGADLTWKWVSSSRTRGPALTLTLEALWPEYEVGPADPRGWYGLVQYRFLRNWWLGCGLGRAEARLDESGSGTGDEAHGQEFPGDLREYKINLTFAPSEFSALRAEVGYYQDKVGMEDDLRFIVQANFTIGSHPAHLY